MIINNKVVKEIVEKTNVKEKEVNLILEAVSKRLDSHIKTYDTNAFRVQYLGKFIVKPFRLWAINNREQVKEMKIKNIKKYRPKITPTDDEDYVMVVYRKNTAIILKKNIGHLIKQIDLENN
jgi:hypothetical protein